MKNNDFRVLFTTTQSQRRLQSSDKKRAITISRSEAGLFLTVAVLSFLAVVFMCSASEIKTGTEAEETGFVNEETKCHTHQHRGEGCRAARACLLTLFHACFCRRLNRSHCCAPFLRLKAFIVKGTWSFHILCS